MKIVMAKTAADLLRGPAVGALLAAPLSPQAAAEACVRLLADRVGGRGGLILLDRNGRPGFAFNTPRMAYGYLAADGSVVVSV